MIFDLLVTLVLAVGGALMGCAFLLTAASVGWPGALVPLVCCLVAYAAIRFLWSRGGEGGNVAESAA